MQGVRGANDYLDTIGLDMRFLRLKSNGKFY
jgi:hypothetical protein